MDEEKPSLEDLMHFGKKGMLDKYTWGGGGRFEGYHNTKISELKKSQDRIDRGELVARTIIFGPRYSKK